MLIAVLSPDRAGTVRRVVASERGTRHYPKHAVWCEPLDRFAFARVTHGGPLGCLAMTVPGDGYCLHPASIAITLSVLALQLGHCNWPLRMRLTRCAKHPKSVN